MSKKNGTIEMSQEQLEQAEHLLGAVNLDEVTIEKIKVKVRVYKEVEALDDDGNPLTDDDGNPLKSRDVTTRTAVLQNFVPLPIYNRMIALRDDLGSSDIAKQIPLMTELVLEVWRVSEPWMTMKKLNEGVDFPVIGALFRIFFSTSRLPNNKA